MNNYLDCVVGEFKKFLPNGDPLLFPGNTFLCHLPKGEFWRFARYVQTQTDITSFAHKFALLPPSSFHMTVYEGICDQVRRQDNWVEGLPLDAPLYQITEYFSSRVSKLPKANSIRMKVVKCTLKGGIMFHVVPFDEETKTYLKNFRNCMQNEMKMKNLNADKYEFHISLAYNLITLTSEEKEELQVILDRINKMIQERDFMIEFGAVEFCYFNDMFHFATLSKIGI